MNKIITALILCFISFPVYADEIIELEQAKDNEFGIILGPIANEKLLIETGIEESLGVNKVYFYNFPLFLGGLYYNKNLSENQFISHTDMQFSVHSVNLTSDPNSKFNNYLLYLHQEINYFPFEQKNIFFGSGLEFIEILHLYDNNNTRISNAYGYYNSLHTFLYLDTGYNFNISDKFNLALKFLYRFNPLENSKINNSGEFSVLAGYKF